MPTHLRMDPFYIKVGKSAFYFNSDIFGQYVLQNQSILKYLLQQSY